MTSIKLDRRQVIGLAAGLASSSFLMPFEIAIADELTDWLTTEPFRTISRLQIVETHARCIACTDRAIGVSPAHGVVDPDLRVHGPDNLYVCSNAVFPSVAAVNAMLILTALALRLGASRDA